MAERVLREARNWSNGRRGTVTARVLGTVLCGARSKCGGQKERGDQEGLDHDGP